MNSEVEHFSLYHFSSEKIYGFFHQFSWEAFPFILNLKLYAKWKNKMRQQQIRCKVFRVIKLDDGMESESPHKYEKSEYE